MSPAYHRLAAGLLCLCSTGFASAQPVSGSPPTEGRSVPLFVTVTANRTPTAIQRTGSAITIIRREEIERANPTSLMDVLRGQPGVFLTEAGGPGASTDIRLRGANANHTLVLVDGVRVNDPAAASGDFDGSVIPPSLIERIEVLRGPQSALYGSDAIGGVINIITKRGAGKPTFSLAIEGGSYGTISTALTGAGAIGPWSFAFAGTFQKSDGFSRYGYRIGRLAGANNIDGVRGGRLEDDGFSRFGGYGRLGYDPGTGFRAEISALAVDSRASFDGGSSLAVPGATTFPDTPNIGVRRFGQIATTFELDAFDTMLTHRLQLSAARTDRSFDSTTLGRVAGVLRVTRRDISDFIGDRYAAEYQATLRLQQFGTIIAGGRYEHERAETFRTDLVPTLRDKLRTLEARQDTGSLFGLWQLPLGERLLLSFGGRHDRVTGSEGVTTWRTTAAYRIQETDTTLRASAGTGAKAATLFQRFSSIGTPDLRTEKSLGVDAGIDQGLFDGRLRLSVTAFANRIQNLIAFINSTPCLNQTGTRCYENIDRARTSGIEASLRAELLPGILAATASYTYLHAKDATTNQTLARRPQHTGRIGVVWTITPDWTFEPSVTFASERFSQSGERQKLAPYARLDMLTAYKINENLKLHARVENLTNARYQDVYNFGTTGRAFYGGFTATW
ncbi:MAG: TonB-dependent receptor plug domain-containing protein [Beijerinckiaceae bacterium]